MSQLVAYLTLFGSVFLVSGQGQKTESEILRYWTEVMVRSVPW